jgi:glycosyltransferase involved in cell wall biosynthesis
MIPVYNCGRYLQETLESALHQALPEHEMQIEVVDDCSTDIDVQELVRKIGKGRIGYYRQPYNVGSLRNFETCLNLSKGYYIHLLHSDDVVLEGFYRQLGTLFKTYENIGAAFCRYRYIDETGAVIFYPEPEAPIECILENWLTRLAERQRVQYVSIAVKREVYEKLGGFCGVHYGEDWEMWARIATKYSFAYTPTVLASYRRHQNSISGRAFVSAQNLKDLEYVMGKINTYLPEPQRVKALKEARKFYAHYAVRTAKQLWIRFRNTKGTLAQVGKAWNMHKDVSLAFEISKVFVRMMLNR